MSTDEIAADFLALADDTTGTSREEDLLWNTARGDLERIEAWEDFSPTGVAQRLAVLADFGSRAEALFRDTSGSERTITASIGFDARSMSVLIPAWRDLYFVQGSSNLITFLTSSVARYPLTTAAHGAGYVAKLRRLPAFLGDWCAGVRAGVAEGYTPTARGVRDTIAELDRWLTVAPADDPLAAQPPPTELGATDLEQWRDDVAAAVRDAVRPAVTAVRTMYVDELTHVARSDDEAGICHRAGGDEQYAQLLWASTSRAIAPEEIHRLGMDTLAVLDDEFAGRGLGLFGTADPVAVRRRLRDDPSLSYDTADEIVADMAAVLDRAWSTAGDWFRTTPSSGCTVTAVQVGPAACYISPPRDLSAPGKVDVNVADPTQWSRSELAATTCHEGIPGHHLQLALVLESDAHPALRELVVGSTCEGWGLYAERLAGEMGVYETPLEELGMAVLDSLRASRLVVDTGLHNMGWSRQRALDFFEAHTTMTHSAAVAEIDRYIADPGQACSYMVGRFEVDALRARASAALGPRFDLPAFHDVLLGSGSPPLDELGRLVDDWIVAAG